MVVVGSYSSSSSSSSSGSSSSSSSDGSGSDSDSTSSCSSSKILTWTGKYKSGVMAGDRVGKCKFGPGPVNTNLEQGAGAKQRAGRQEIQAPVLK